MAVKRETSSVPMGPVFSSQPELVEFDHVQRKLPFLCLFRFVIDTFLEAITEAIMFWE